jgi:hypothetical protein
MAIRRIWVLSCFQRPDLSASRAWTTAAAKVSVAASRKMEVRGIKGGKVILASEEPFRKDEGTKTAKPCARNAIEPPKRSKRVLGCF